MRLKENLLKEELNVSLLGDAISFFRGTLTSWKEKYGFNYPGEALERFLERKVCQDAKDARAFVLAACLTHNRPYEFYGSQRSHFSNVVMSVPEFKQDRILNLLVAVWENLEKVKEIPAISSSNELNEQFVLLYISRLFPVLNNADNILSMVRNIDLKELSNKEVHERADFILELASIQEEYRYKKSSFKKVEEVYEYLLHAWRLAKNELKISVQSVDWESEVSPYVNQMHCSAKDVVSLNHLLVNSTDGFSKVTSNGKQRLFEEYLKVHLLSDEVVSDSFKKQVSSSSLSLQEISFWIHQISNDENLLYVSKIAYLPKLTFTTGLVSLLERAVITDEIAREIIKKFLEDGNNYHIDKSPFSKHDWVNSGDDSYSEFYSENAKYQFWNLVEKKRLELDFNITYDVSPNYLQVLFDLGIYKPNDIETIIEKELLYLYKKLVQRTTDRDQYLRYLTYMPIEEREFMFEDSRYRRYERKIFFNFDVFNAVENKSEYVSIVFETLYHHHPNQYADELFELYKNDRTLSMVGIEKEELAELLKMSKENGLFQSTQIAFQVTQMFMTEEEKVKEEKNKFLSKLEEAETSWDIRQRMKEVNRYLSSVDVQDAFLIKLAGISIRFDSDLQEIYTSLRELENENNQPFIEKAMETLSSLILNFEKLDKEKVDYYHFVHQLLQKNASEKENK